MMMVDSRKGLARRLVDDHRKLAQRRHPHKALTRIGILQINDLLLERERLLRRAR